MYIFAFLLLVAAFLCAIFCAGAAGIQLWQKQTSALGLVEKGSWLITALMTLSSFILLSALINHDFSVEYVARYSDRYLPLFYRITAFWAGQEGSILFWGWSVGIFGVFFLVSKTYAKLTAETKLWFWMFFLTIIGFFLLIITGWSNPFITFNQPLQDGQGLNPLLQNPGMIFHPPLLFLGYGGFVIPGCLALAQTLSRKREEEGLWSVVGRPFTMTAWMLLSAGIILGAWWAYMELGWGGYWAWDPVENASLIPWLISTAFLHTSVVEVRRGKLPRFNVFLMGLTTISAFFATYIVRSGAIESLHAYPDGGVGFPLLSFVVLSTIVTFIVAFGGEFKSRPLSSPSSRESMLLLVAMFLLAMGVIILTATMWPVLSKTVASIMAVFSPDTVVLSRGLGPEFYNRVCLPIFAFITVLLVFCPWVSWGGGLRNATVAVALAAVLILGVPLFWMIMEAPEGLSLGEKISALFKEGPRHPMAPLAASAAVAVAISLVILFVKNKKLLNLPATVSAHGIHIGLILMVLGIAFSGPYQVEETFSMRMGQSTNLGSYNVTLDKIYSGEAPGYSFYEAELIISRNGKEIGVMSPQRRQYIKYPQAFAEASTIFSMGNEIYASLLRVDPNRGLADLHISLNPLVNWVWFGGIVLCLFPLIGLFGNRNREDD